MSDFYSDLYFELDAVYKKFFPDGVLIDPIDALRKIKEVELTTSEMLKEEIENLESEICEMSSEIEDLEDENRSLEDRIEDLENDMAALKNG